MSSAFCFNLDQSKILLSDTESNISGWVRLVIVPEKLRKRLRIVGELGGFYSHY